jgi:hypothetical protein
LNEDGKFHAGEKFEAFTKKLDQAYETLFKFINKTLIDMNGDYSEGLKTVPSGIDYIFPTWTCALCRRQNGKESKNKDGESVCKFCEWKRPTDFN